LKLQAEFLSGILPLEDFAHIIALSLGISLCATTLATLIGLSLGAALAVYDFPGGRVIVVLCNAFFGLPPVTVGLGLYLLLSRSGPLGLFGLLFTPGAMVLAQTALATPIVTALAHRAVEDAWSQYGGALMVDGATRLRLAADAEVFAPSRTSSPWNGFTFSQLPSPASGGPSPRSAPS
jgi:tungstate transport system permease protein